MSDHNEPPLPDGAANGDDARPTARTPAAGTGPDAPAAPTAPAPPLPTSAPTPEPGAAPGPATPSPRLRSVLTSWAGPIAIAVVGIVAPVLAIVLRTGSSDADPAATVSRSVTSASADASGPTTSAAVVVSATPTLTASSATPTVSASATTKAPQGPPSCAPPKPSHGLSVSFVSPCTGGSVKAPYFDITLAVPSYPAENGSQGSVWVFVKILGNGRGESLKDQPLYATYPVQQNTAREIGPGTWIRDVQAYETCRDHGPAEILAYWLPAHDASAVATWRPGQAVTLPRDVVLLDSVTVNVRAAC